MERMKDQREKKKEKEKDMAPTEHKEYIDIKRKKVRERVQKYRQQLKEKNSNDVDPNYSNRATLGKAKAKVLKALPQSAAKKKVVLVSIVNELDENERVEILNVLSPSNQITKKSVPQSFDKLAKDITEFYERDDVSRMSPKMRDVKKYSNKQTGNVELLPTRHMIMTIREAYALFIEDRCSKQEGIKIEMM